MRCAARARATYSTRIPPGDSEVISSGSTTTHASYPAPWRSTAATTTIRSSLPPTNVRASRHRAGVITPDRAVDLARQRSQGVSYRVRHGVRLRRDGTGERRHCGLADRVGKTGVRQMGADHGGRVLENLTGVATVGREAEALARLDAERVVAASSLFNTNSG